MTGSTVALVCTDPPLARTIEQVVTSIPDSRLVLLSAIADARLRVDEDGVSLVLVHLPDRGSGAEAEQLLRALATAQRPVATLMLSDRHHADQALTLLRAGAADYLSRPLDLGRLAYLVDTLTVRHRYAGPRRAAAADVLALPLPGFDDPFFYVISPGMHQVLAQVRRVAPKDTTLLLRGETGTGKTRLARLIHDLSPRRQEPLVVVHCGDLSANLIESELFGHVKGAFTGADRDHAGKFAAVGRGTLLLDEIDSLPLPLQTKLLRAVDEHVFEPVGSNKPQRLQARLIAASNRVLEDEVAAGRFRQDLYYRLNVVGFYLPALRDRRQAIPALAEKFLAEFAKRHSVHVQAMAPDVLRVLQEHDWPGNVRELRNIIERAVALCAGTVIQMDDLPDDLRAVLPEIGPCSVYAGVAAAAVVTLAESKDETELLRITQALERHKNNRLRAAAELGISRMTLYKKLHKHGLIAAS